MFHKEGHRIIGIAILIVVIINMFSFYLLSEGWGQKLILIGSLIFLILILQFFRNPKRLFVNDDNYILAPVDGKVVVIEEVYEKEYFKENRLQVSVFMSPVNVHVTRYPVGGKVKYSKYHPGKFLVAWHPKSSELNERTTVVVENPVFGEILFRQVAGALAKRIVNYAEVGKNAIQASDSGFIKFGSRVDMFLPVDTKLKIELNQKVRGGETIIAKEN